MTIHTKKSWTAPLVKSVAHMSAAEAKDNPGGEDAIIVGNITVTTGPGS